MTSCSLVETHERQESTAYVFSAEVEPQEAKRPLKSPRTLGMNPVTCPDVTAFPFYLVSHVNRVQQSHSSQPVAFAPLRHRQTTAANMQPLRQEIELKRRQRTLFSERYTRTKRLKSVQNPRV